MASLSLPTPMRRALDLAAEAAAAGEVPVGAVITLDDRIVSEAGNAMRTGNDPTAHAEMVALRAAGSALGTSRLDRATLWVSLEPCPMCAAAAGLARVARIVFAAEDPKGGGVLHGPRIFAQPTCHHRPEVFGGLDETRSATLLKTFFQAKR